MQVIHISSDLQKKLDKQNYENNKLEKKLCRLVGQAIGDFKMIEDGDTVMVCLSGGKDSYTMLDILLLLQTRAPINFSIIAMNLDQKQPNFPNHILPEYLTQKGVPFHIETQDTYSVVKRVIPEGNTTCGLCSRMRRAILYRVANQLGATKVALGHHRGDILETFLMNLFHGGKIKAMPPKLLSDDGQNIVIRPLAYVPEADIIRYANQKQYPIIPCDLCGSQPNLERNNMKEMLKTWQKKFPGRIENMLRGLQNIVPSHVLDHQLFDFQDLATQKKLLASQELKSEELVKPFLGDIAFDDDNRCG